MKMKFRRSAALFAALLFAAMNLIGGVGAKVFAASPAAEVTLENGSTKSFNDFREAWEYADENMGSTIKMLSDWNLNGDTLVAGSWAISPSNFTLDLNGHTIDGGGDTILSIQASFLSKYMTVTEMTIVDTSAAKTGRMKNGGSVYNGGIVVKGILHFDGGTLCDCVCDGTQSYGGGIYVANETRQSVVTVYPAGTLTMDGGRIENCTEADIGGGIFLGERSTAHLISGSISGCTTENIGGGVFVDSRATLTMENGFKISNCKADETGGGIHVTPRGTLIMNGGSITGCSAKRGGGIYVSPSGADVEGHFLDAATADLFGGSITGNSCTENGGGIGTYGAFLSSPPFITLGGSITVKDNTKNGKPNNFFLDTATFDDDTVVFSVKNGDLSGQVGISCDEKRRISNADPYRNREHIFADNPDWAVVYSNADQCFYLADSKPVPALVSAELTTNPEGAWTDYDYANHIATINIPRPIGDAETVMVSWTGEHALVDDGSWKGNYTTSPTGMTFYNFAGVQLFEQYITLSNTNGDSVKWLVKIKGVEKEILYICNGTIEGYVPYETDPEKGYGYYKFYPGTPLCIVADEAPEGMVFDRWRASSGSGVFLEDDQAYSERLVMNMESTFNRKFGLKACYKEAEQLVGMFGFGAAPTQDIVSGSDSETSFTDASPSDVSSADDEALTEGERNGRKMIVLSAALCLLLGALLGSAITLLVTKARSKKRGKLSAECSEADPVEEPVSEPVAESVDEPAEEPADELAEEPADEPVEEPADEPVDELAEEPADEPVDEPAEEPVDEPAAESAETPSEE